MDHLNSLSNDELRRKLLEYGCTTPVTQTTRKILIKKLRQYDSNQRSSLHRATTALTRYSSDEETSDREMQPPKSTTVTGKRSGKNHSMPPPASNSPPRSAVYVSPLVQHSDDDDEIERVTNKLYSFSPTYARLAKRSTYGSGLRTSPTTTAALPHRGSSGQSFLGSFDRSSIHGGSGSAREATGPTSNGHNEDEYLTNLAKKYTSSYDRNVAASSRPSLRRPTQQTLLSSIRARHFGESLGALSESEIVHQVDRQSHESTKSTFLTKLSEHTFVPCILLSILMLFFAILAINYIVATPNLASIVSLDGTVYSLCSYSNYDAIGETCIENDNLELTLDLIKLAVTELQRRMEQNKCYDPTIPSTMSATEVLSMAKRNYPTQHLSTLMNCKDTMEYLVNRNPQWTIINCDANGQKLRFEDVIQLRPTQSNHFVLVKPQLPFRCAFAIKAKSFFLIVGLFSLVTFGVYMGYLVYRLINDHLRSTHDKKITIISMIIEALMEKADEDPENSQIVINHLRDKVLSQSRRKWAKAWEQAINDLEKTDSRIKFEIGTRNGEECQLIKWVDTVKSAQKVWDGPAFIQPNNIDPPTQCLKIRHMFEKHEVKNPNLKQSIQDALLEKVGSNCKIHEIELELSSCCVYVRCATTADAGIVHNLVNGYWFDGRLISTKFLRLERYMHRFPHSTNVRVLQPSNTKNSSMAYYTEGNGRIRTGLDDD